MEKNLGERSTAVLVEAVTPSGEAWAQVRAFLVRHMPHSWKLLGTVLRAETAKGGPVPRDGEHQWFVAKSSTAAGGDDELRGVLLVMLQIKSAEAHAAHADKAANVSLFVADHGPAGESVVRAMLEKVDLADGGEVRFAGLASEWLTLVRERAEAAGARESWFNPCLALHCPEPRFVRPPGEDPDAFLRAQSLRLDAISADSSDSHVMASKWKYASEESDDYIVSCVRHSPAACIRREGDEMVAWIGLHADMSLGFFWVQESHRRKGLGKVLAVNQVLTTFDYVRPYLEPDQVAAYFFTEAVNDASKTLFQSLGFEVYSEVVWVAFKSHAENQTAAVVGQRQPAKEVAKVNLAEKLALFGEHWSPKIVGEVDNFDVKVAKLKGEFVWHHHENEDELFLVIKGNLVIKIREQDGSERDIDLGEGEFFVVPKGVEHKPIAAEECHVMLLEQRGVLNTGNVRSQHTVDNLQRL